jgi:hypothetical protein
MRVNYQTSASTGFQVLSEDQKSRIYRAALRILQHTGVLGKGVGEWSVQES